MEDSRPKVGLDVDGVLASFVPKFCQMANEKYGLSIKPEDQTSFLYGGFNLSEAQLNGLWEEIQTTQNWWWKSLAPMAETDALIDASKAFRIYFITSRVPTIGLPVEDQTAYWLREHFYLTNPTVLVSSQKGPLAAALNLDYFIDDRPENCVDVLTFNPYTRVFLHDLPLNHSYKEPRRIERVFSLNEFFQVIQGGVSGSTSKRLAA